MATETVGETSGEREQRLRADLASLRIERGGGPHRAAPRRRGRRLALLAGALTALAVLAFLGLRARARPVVVAQATRALSGAGGEAALLSGSGYIVTGDRYRSIGVRVPGRIDRYFVEEGQSVKQGAPLVQIDDRDYRAALDRAKAGLELARANAGLAASELRRGEALSGSGVISRQEIDVLRNKAEVARASVAQLAAELEQARVSLEYTVLRAPTDGVVLAKLKEVGEIAVPGGFAGSGDLIRIANLSDIRAEVDVNESELGRVHIGGRAQVTPDAYPDARYDARVVKLYPQVDRQKGTLKVEVRLLEPDARLLPDMSARVSFLADPSASGERASAAAEQEAPALLVPSAAVRGDSGEAFVWVVREGRAVRTPVATAGTVGDRTRVASGLGDGDTVVVGEPPSHDGEKVSLAGAP